MERRSLVVTVAVVLSLAAIAAAGSYITSAPATSEATGLPQPAPALALERQQPDPALPGGGTVALAPGARAGDHRAPAPRSTAVRYAA